MTFSELEQMDPEELKQVAYGIYREIKNIIHELNQAFNNMAKCNNSDEKVQRSFDVVLEYLMFTIANSDGVLFPVELEFLDYLTDDSTLLNGVNSRLGTDYSWKDLRYISGNEQRVVINTIESVFSSGHELADFAHLRTADIVQFNSKKFDEITDDVSTILVLMSVIDGNADASEINSINDLANVFKKRADDDIRELLNRAKQDDGTSYSGGKR